ncbi:hypothetical protein VSR01_16230 [Actinacidiphila sp. DG2A-62]|uniref:hypothetical protein n=1 Tax=Actinacidiphila sp. DG2A-62 TaxID=3108821 RepID=UPI002DBD18B2|nr:hypothetical protein [Actinacidiphila sp. DG2A-62]MEC3994993.1 hypothetical protein [Actinacidiphila sp. DG2A-62]
MSMRYFRTLHGVAQYGNLTDDGAQVLADAGHEKITAQEHDQAVAAAAEAAPALGVPQVSDEQTQEADTDGGNKRKRRR